MKLRKSLADKDWQVYHNPLGSNNPEQCYWVHEYANGFVKGVARPPLSREYATAIAALPKLYNACLTNLVCLRHYQNQIDPIFDMSIPDEKTRGERANLERNIKLTLSALDAVNCEDEPQTEGELE